MAETKKNIGILIDDGSQRVSIENKYGKEIGVFYFRPTDLGIIERYNSMVDNFEYITEPLESVNIGPDGEVDSNSKTELEALESAKKRLYDAVNKLLGEEDAAEAFFGVMHPFSPVNGKFYCENALEGLGKYISEQLDAETAKFKKRVERYTKKYQK